MTRRTIHRLKIILVAATLLMSVGIGITIATWRMPW